MTDSETALVVAVISLVAALLVAAVGALVTLSSAKRDRRRLLYSEAVRSILAWEEMVYRVRRRSDDLVPSLIARFHEMHDDLNYHRAWIGSDSKYMQRSYEALVTAVKSATQSLIQDAWRAALRKPPGDRLPEDEIPIIDSHVDAFLQDVRDHLSPWLWPRIRTVCRHRGSPP